MKFPKRQKINSYGHFHERATRKTRQISKSKKENSPFFVHCNQTGDALHGQMQALSLDEKKRVFGKSAVRLSTFYLFKSAGFTVVVATVTTT